MMNLGGSNAGRKSASATPNDAVKPGQAKRPPAGFSSFPRASREELTVFLVERARVAFEKAREGGTGSRASRPGVDSYVVRCREAAGRWATGGARFEPTRWPTGSPTPAMPPSNDQRGARPLLDATTLRPVANPDRDPYRPSTSPEIGMGLTALGAALIVLGVLFFFDRGLLAMGNALFLAGLAATVGPRPAARFFARPRNHRGTGFFLAGFLVVLWGWPLVGMAAEGYGLFLLFAGFAPTALHFLRGVPGLATALDHPSVKAVLNKIAPADSLPI